MYEFETFSSLEIAFYIGPHLGSCNKEKRINQNEKIEKPKLSNRAALSSLCDYENSEKVEEVIRL